MSRRHKFMHVLLALMNFGLISTFVLLAYIGFNGSNEALELMIILSFCHFFFKLLYKLENELL